MRRRLTDVTASPGLAVFGSLARFDFDEDDGRAVARDDVDFSTASPVSARNYRVPAPFQFSTSEIFPSFPKVTRARLTASAR